jgi:glycosyltransferase involved in cell wall biosynthesis
MLKGHVVMGLLFFPRGGSAQVARYLSMALVDAGRSVGLVTGSLGGPGEETNAATFFGGGAVHALDYSAALRAFELGESAVAAPVPMHPSYEDRDDAPDVVFAAVPDRLASHLSSIWEQPLRDAGVERAEVVHLHHLTPQHDAIERWWPDRTVVAHLHGTEMKFLQGVDERSALATRLGTTLAEMPSSPAADLAVTPRLSDRERALLAGTRWDHWRHGDAWQARLRAQAHRAHHLIAVSPTERAMATEVLGVDEDRVTAIPNGVDVHRFRPRPMPKDERRALFRRWLVEDPRGWDETGQPGTISYREHDLDRLLGDDGDTTVLIYVGRFIGFKRVPLLVRAFARAAPAFERPASLLIWGGHPGEWEGEHPATVARQVGGAGVFFAGWRGHRDLPHALAACDALVTPTVGDPFPQTTLEAMAVGLPVVATDSGGYPWMVNVDPAHPTGWLVPPDDEAALAATMVDVVRRPDEIRRRGAAALTHARANFSWARRVDAVEEVYELARDRNARRVDSVVHRRD